jgi:hypothetical protein
VPLFHLVNGDATAVKLRASPVLGTVSVWADVLHEGPTPRGLSGLEWIELRARFIAQAGYESYEEARRRLLGWDRALETFPNYDEVVLWYEHDLFDQLALIRLLAWLSRRDPGPTRLSLVSVSSHPEVERFIGLGQLQPDELALLFESRRALGSEELSLAVRAWDAFCAPEPSGIENLVEEALPLPFLAPALRRHLQEFPSLENGLSRSERQILECLTAGPLSPVGLFRAAQQREDRLFLGDWSFWRTVKGLPPLVQLEVESRARELPQAGRVSLSETGRAVLLGEQDWVRLQGIDRWLGGVHLQGAEARWRWDEAQKRLVESRRAP